MQKLFNRQSTKKRINATETVGATEKPTTYVIVNLFGCLRINRGQKDNSSDPIDPDFLLRLLALAAILLMIFYDPEDGANYLPLIPPIISK